MNTKILYILGYGHSGSTLMNQILGSAKNSFSVGEFMFFRNRWNNKNWRNNKISQEKNVCDCGQLHRCKLWKSVSQGINMDQTYNHPDYSDSYFKTFNYLYFNQNKEFFSHTFNDGNLYSIILKNSKKLKPETKLIVDSSKNLNRLILLKNNPDLDVKVIYLKRDLRGVISSMEKQNVFFLKTYFIWVVNNLLMRKFVKKLSESDKLEISYDYFAQNPKKYLKQINQKFETNIDLENYIDNVNKEQYHNFSGNGMRNKKLESIKYDQSWKKRMSKPKQIILTILCYIPNKLWVYNKK